MKEPSCDRDNCSQVFLGLASQHIDVYHMPSNQGGHILQAYQDFLPEQGLSETLYRNLAPEKKIEEIISINRNFHIIDSSSEVGYPN